MVTQIACLQCSDKKKKKDTHYNLFCTIWQVHQLTFRFQNHTPWIYIRCFIKETYSFLILVSEKCGSIIISSSYWMTARSIFKTFQWYMLGTYIHHIFFCVHFKFYLLRFANIPFYQFLQSVTHPISRITI